MAETLVTELTSPEARKALAEAILALFHQWNLHLLNQAELLGLNNMSALNRGEPLPENPQVLERVGHLLAIERALTKHFPFDLNRRDSWIETANPKLENELPLKIMLVEGVEGMKKVRELAESLKSQAN